MSSNENENRREIAKPTKAAPIRIRIAVIPRSAVLQVLCVLLLSCATCLVGLALQAMVPSEAMANQSVHLTADGWDTGTADFTLKPSVMKWRGEKGNGKGVTVALGSENLKNTHGDKTISSSEGSYARSEGDDKYGIYLNLKKEMPAGKTWNPSSHTDVFGSDPLTATFSWDNAAVDRLGITYRVVLVAEVVQVKTYGMAAAAGNSVQVLIAGDTKDNAGVKAGAVNACSYWNGATMHSKLTKAAAHANENRIAVKLNLRYYLCKNRENASGNSGKGSFDNTDTAIDSGKNREVVWAFKDLDMPDTTTSDASSEFSESIEFVSGLTEKTSSKDDDGNALYAIHAGKAHTTKDKKSYPQHLKTEDHKYELKRKDLTRVYGAAYADYDDSVAKYDRWEASSDDEETAVGFAARANAGGFRVKWAGCMCATALTSESHGAVQELKRKVVIKKEEDGDTPTSVYEFHLKQTTSEDRSAAFHNAVRRAAADAYNHKKDNVVGLTAKNADDDGKARKTVAFTLNFTPSKDDSDGYTSYCTNFYDGDYATIEIYECSGDAGDKADDTHYATGLVGVVKCVSDLQGGIGNGQPLVRISRGSASYLGWTDSDHASEDSRTADPNDPNKVLGHIQNVTYPKAALHVAKDYDHGSTWSQGWPEIAGKYTFTAVPANGTAENENNSDFNEKSAAKTVKNGGTGTGDSYSLGSITYRKPGTYLYKVTEKGTVAGVANDALASSGKYIQVTVAASSDKRKLTVTKAEAADSSGGSKASDAAYAGASGESGGVRYATVRFTNSWDEPVEAAIPVTKELDVGAGATAPDIEGGFTFTLAPLNDAAQDGANSDFSSGSKTVKNPDSDGGTAEFGKVTYYKPGTYKYKVTESGTVDGVYNARRAATGKTVTVTVAKDRTVTLSPKGGQTLTNHVPSPAKLAISVRKDVRDLSSGEAPDITGRFTFALAAANVAAKDGNMSDFPSLPKADKAIKSAKAGQAVSFGEIEYVREGTYEYKVTESGEADGFENDGDASSGKAVTVTVAYDRSANKLVATADPETAQVSFTNTYRPPIDMPFTGSEKMRQLLIAGGFALAGLCTVIALHAWNGRERQRVN